MYPSIIVFKLGRLGAMKCNTTPAIVGLRVAPPNLRKMGSLLDSLRNKANEFVFAKLHDLAVKFRWRFKDLIWGR
jgi:hypothetical protein